MNNVSRYVTFNINNYKISMCIRVLFSIYKYIYIVVQSARKSNRNCVRYWNRVITTGRVPTLIRAHTDVTVHLDIPDRRVTTVRISILILFPYPHHVTFDVRAIFTGVVLDITANFSGNSYLQLDNNLLDKTKKEHSISMTFTTDSANGLLYWQGQEPNNDGVIENFIAVSSTWKNKKKQKNKNHAFVKINSIEFVTKQRNGFT